MGAGGLLGPLWAAGIAGFLEGKVTSIGNGAKVGCPEEYIGRRVYIIILKE